MNASCRIIYLTAICLTSLFAAARRARAGESAALQFLEPAAGAIFSTEDEIPLSLKAFAPDDVVLSAEFFANNSPGGSVAYCCQFCPCPLPKPGLETVLRIPAEWNSGLPPARMWRGWKPPHAGVFRLTASATGQNGTVLIAAPVTITVVDLNLHIFLNSEGGVMFVIPQGSLVPGSYEMEASENMISWARLGPFQPGNVAAFFVDQPPAGTRAIFYRAVYTAPRSP
jgi:hypothetical protein